MDRRRRLALAAAVVLLAVLGVVVYRAAVRPADSFPPAGTPIDSDVVAELDASGPWLVAPGSLEDGTVPRVIAAGRTTDAHLSALSQVRVLFSLDLGNSEVTDEGLRQLAGLQNLTRLNLRNSRVTGSGIKYLFGLRNITMFQVDPGQVNDEVLAHLVAGNQLHIWWGEQFRRETRIGGGWITIEPANPDEVTKLSLVDTSVTDAGLKHLAELKNLSSLTLGQGETDAGLEMLSQCKNLAYLHLQDSRVTIKGLKTVIGLSKLELLHLSSRQLNDEALATLASANRLHILSNADKSGPNRPSGEGEVEKLSLDDTSVTDAGLKHLAGLLNLDTLSVGSGVTDDGLKELTRFPKLKLLDLRSSRVTAQGLRHLIGLRNIASLLLDSRQLTDESLATLANANRLHILSNARRSGDDRPSTDEQVHEFTLEGTSVTAAGLKHLAGLKNLSSFSLGEGGADAFLEELSRFPKLTSVSIECSSVTDAGLQHLSKLKHLSTLLVWNAQITDASLEVVSGFPGLTSLGFWSCPVTDAGLMHLKRLKNLTELRLVYTYVTESGVAEFRKALPNCKVIWKE